MIDACIQEQLGRRRIFWTTQPRGCGDYTACDGDNCTLPGLQYVESTNPQQPTERTIRNDNWLTGLVLNIINTRARTDSKCPSPVAMYGHWSESYRDDGVYVGATLWNVIEKSYARVKDAVHAIETAIQADVSKLISLKLVNNVNVDAQYQGRNSVAISITLITMQSKHVINLSGSFAAGEWVWE